MRWRLVFTGAVALATGACDEPYLSVTVRPTADVLKISMRVVDHANLKVDGRTVELEDREGHVFIALERFEPGRNEVTIAGEIDGRAVEKKVPFMVPNGLGAPFLQLHRCTGDRGSNANVTTLRGSFGQVKSCLANEGMTFEVQASANPDAKVRVGPDDLEADEDGNLTIELDATKNLLEVEVGRSAFDSEDVVVPIPIRVEAGKQTLEGHIDVEVQAYGQILRLLRGFQPGKPLHAGLDPQGAVVAYRRDDATPQFFGSGRLKDIAWIAIGTSKTPRKAADCGPYTSIDGKGGSMMATRMEHDVEVHLYDARTGVEKATETFSATGLPCPGGATSVDFKKPVVDLHPPPSKIAEWIEQLP